jgi:predicted ATPase
MPKSADAKSAEVARDDVLDLLIRLVDRSMVVREPWQDGSRYRLLETLRQYAGERLAADDDGAAEVRRRHALWCASLVSGPPPTDGHAHAAWRSTLDVEHDNVRAALEWSVGRTRNSG